MQAQKSDIQNCTKDKQIANSGSGYVLNELEDPTKKKLQFICQNKLKFSFSLIITDKEFQEKDISWMIQQAEDFFTKNVNKNGKFMSVKLNKIPYDQEFKEKLASYEFNQIQCFTHLFPIYFTTDDREIKIYIKESNQLQKDQKEMKFLISTTIKDVILEYGALVNKDFENASLSFFGDVRAFDISKSLQQCKVQDGNKVDVILRNQASGDQAGTAFVNMKQIPKQINFSQNAPKWRYADKGLNIEGHCKNKDCEAFNQMVIFMYKLGTFDLIKDRKKVACPICKKYFKPETCGFTLCSYTISGKFLDDTDGQEKFIEPIQKSVSGNFYYRFDSEGGKDDLSYIQLTIFTEPLKKEIVPHQEQEVELTENCSLCCSEINENEKYKSPCNFHKCHDDCLDEITKQTNQISFKTCPSCDRSG